MKKALALTLAILVLLSAVVFTGCSNDDDENDNTPNAADEFDRSGLTRDVIPGDFGLDFDYNFAADEFDRSNLTRDFDPLELGGPTPLSPGQLPPMPAPNPDGTFG